MKAMECDNRKQNASSSFHLSTFGVCLICKRPRQRLTSGQKDIKEVVLICRNCSRHLPQKFFNQLKMGEIVTQKASQKKFYKNILVNLGQGGVLKCRKCDKPFFHAENFFCHLTRHIPQRKRQQLAKHLCKFILRHYSDARGRTGHNNLKRTSDMYLGKHHACHPLLKIKCILRSGITSDFAKENWKNSKLLVICRVCSKFYGSVLSYRMHFKSHDSVKKRKSFKTIPLLELSLKSRIKSRIKNKLKCRKETNKTNTKKFQVKSPVKNGKSELGCHVCKKQFSSKSCLNRHIRIIHEGEKPYKCDECGERFSERVTLRKHMTKHTGIPLPKNYHCELCGKFFVRKGVLNNHMRRHSDQNLPCPHCHKIFAHKKILDRHITTHTNEKKFKCIQCQSRFLTKSNLERHIKIHTNYKPFQCDVCKKSFRQKGNLKSHVRMHAGIKPFTCNKCGKSFTQSGNLRQHMLIHEGKRPIRLRKQKKEYADMSKDDKNENTFNVHLPRMNASFKMHINSDEYRNEKQQIGKKGIQQQSETSDGDIIMEAVCSADITKSEENKDTQHILPAIFLPTAVQNLPSQPLTQPIQNPTSFANFQISPYNHHSQSIFPVATNRSSEQEVYLEQSMSQTNVSNVSVTVSCTETSPNIRYIVPAQSQALSYTLHKRAYHVINDNDQ